jgi:tRNA1(Val) A37 N6-methylase TrmN6
LNKLKDKIILSPGDIKKVAERINEKFDVIVMNPPYQVKSEASVSKTQAIWDKFVKKAVEFVKKDGHLVAVHPSGWRGCGKIFNDAQVLKEKLAAVLGTEG